jgi:hypothetical protein
MVTLSVVILGQIWGSFGKFRFGRGSFGKIQIFLQENSNFPGLEGEFFPRFHPHF